jgi:eukaryotic-like serine/threonine-protein kinase
MDSPVQEGDLLAGKYRVEKVLGFGGMGVVVSAFRGDLEQRVAVKFLTQAAAERPDAAERFRREARAAAKIRSEHVARVLDVGTLDTGLPYMVMEYLEGNDIAEELRRVGRLPMLEAVEFILQSIEALAEAHAAGVVHRDLKPSNLFLARRADGTRRVKVLDFGISKALTGTSVEELSLTKTAALIGSPLYMAPEQMRSAKDVDTRADIWSLGAMLYEMLTGEPPYTGESIPQLCAALLHDEPIPLRQHRPEIPEGLEQAVLRCLMKNRDHRFPTVWELGRALLPFALADSRIHVERAERVLGATDVTVSGMSPMTARPSLPQSAVPAASVPITPLTVTPVAVIEPTVNSWGGTDPVPAPKRRGLLLAIAGVVAVFAAAGGLWAARSSSTPESKAPAPATSPSVEVAKADAKVPVLAPPPEVTAAPDAATSPSDSGDLAGTPVPPVSALPATNGKTKAALVTSTKAATKKTETNKPDVTAPPPPKTGGVTDFGGRR